MFKYVKDLIHFINAHDYMHILISYTYTYTCINHMQMNVYTSLFDTHIAYSNLGLCYRPESRAIHLSYFFIAMSSFSGQQYLENSIEMPSGKYYL